MSHSSQFHAEISFSTTLDFSSKGSYNMGQVTIDSPLEFDFVIDGKSNYNSSTLVRMIGDDTHKPIFNGMVQHGLSEPYDESLGSINLVEFSYDGHDVFYRIYSPLEKMNRPINAQEQNLTDMSITVSDETLLNLTNISLKRGKSVSLYSLTVFEDAEVIAEIDNPQFGPNDNFDVLGYRVDINFDYAVAAVRDTPPGQQEKSGLIVVLDPDNGNLIRYIDDPSSGGNDRGYNLLGEDIQLKDHELLAGLGQSYANEAFLFDLRTGDVLHTYNKLTSPTTTDGSHDYFGSGVAMSDTVVYIGAKGYQSNTGIILMYDKETEEYIGRITSPFEGDWKFGENLKYFNGGEDGRLVAFSNDRARIMVFDTADNSLLYSHNQGGSVGVDAVLIHEGKLYIGVPQGYGGDGYVNVYDYSTGDMLTTIVSPRPHWSTEDFGQALAMSGRTLLVIDKKHPFIDDESGATTTEVGGVFGLNIDDNYAESFFFNDPNWNPFGETISVYGDRCIIGSPGSADADGDIVSGKVRILSLRLFSG